MSRHAATANTHRSRSAEAAHRAGLVHGTIDLTAASALTARERVVNVAARNGAALAIVAAGVWIYDISRVLGVA